MWAVWLVVKVVLVVFGTTALIEGATTVLGCQCHWCVQRRSRMRDFFRRAA